MLYIVLGIVGFIVIHLFDLVSLKRVPRAKPAVWASGSGLLIYSLVMICLAPDKLVLPVWLTWLGWGLLSLSLPLLIYSLFVGLPFRKTYLTTGIGDSLITTGVYALTRHPGVIWFTILMLALIPVSGSEARSRPTRWSTWRSTTFWKRARWCGPGAGAPPDPSAWCRGCPAWSRLS